MMDAKDTASRIVDVFQQFRMAPTDIDKFEQVGRGKMIDKLGYFIGRNRPVCFSMLGFPFKSGNQRDKVLGELPDLGEELSLKNFNTFSQKVKEVYPPGAGISLVSDGYAFNQIFRIPDSTVQQYAEINREMSKRFPIRWYDMKDFYRIGMDEARVKLLEQWAPTPEEMQRRILFDPNVNYLYRGMIIFMKAETDIWPFKSNSERTRETKALVRRMMVMNEAYSALIQHEFSDHIRLSMHKSDNSGTKYSFQLIPGPHEKIWTSPWHGAVLQEHGGDYAMIHRKEADAAGYELVYKDGQPYFYKETP